MIELHKPEESLRVDLSLAVGEGEIPVAPNAIQDYFDHTKALIARLVRPEFSTDREVLGLILLGVVSASEFYFRTIIASTLALCPFAQKAAARAQIPIGAVAYYGSAYQALALSALEHKSFTASDTITAEIKRLLGISVEPKSSVAVALSSFDLLCEIRHAAVHSRGFVSFKGVCEMGVSATRSQQVLLSQNVVFDLIKVAHNSVRSTNRYLFEAVLRRWIAERYLLGSWRRDRRKFSGLFNAYVLPAESPFGSDVEGAYAQIKDDVRARAAAA